MIQPNELRIGNWVNGYGPMKIIGINKESPINKLLTPIPLTSEILKKCGLHPLNNYFKQFGIHIQPDKSFIGYFEDNEFGHETEDEVKITSLHQLQNLYFALTGKELEYNATTNS